MKTGWFFFVLLLILGCEEFSEGRQFNVSKIEITTFQFASPSNIGDNLEEAFLYPINHVPGEPTLNHDYYDPSARQLLHLVEIAHTNKIVLNMRKSVYAPTKERQLGYYVQALKEIEYTLGRIVNHPRALLLLQTVSKVLKKPYLAKQYYQRAVSMYPQRAVPQAQFGKYLTDDGEVLEGIEKLKLAVKLDPKLGVAHAWLSLAYDKQGESELAEKFAQKAKDLGYKGKLP